MNAGISVSRVGGAAQTGVIKKLGGGIRLALAQFRELAAFSQFASDLDEATRRSIERGERVTELMKQKQYAPMSVAEQALSIYAVNNGYMDKVEKKKIVAFEEALQSYAKTQHAAFLKSVNDKPELSKEVEAGYKKICDDFAVDRSLLIPWPARRKSGSRSRASRARRRSPRPWKWSLRARCGARRSACAPRAPTRTGSGT